MAEEIEFVDNVRAAMGAMAHGGMRFIMLVKGTLDDINGAIEANQDCTAVSLMLDCLIYCRAIQGALESGDIYHSTAFQEVGFDPFVDATATDIEEAFRPFKNVTYPVPKFRLEEMRKCVLRLAEETERRLGLDRNLPDVRRPDGLFPALRLGREFDKIMRIEHLPSIFPKAWSALDE